MVEAGAQENGGPAGRLATGKDDGGKVVNGVVQNDSEAGGLSKASNDDIQLVLQTFRLFVADLCQQYGMGHPGGAMGMAAIGVALFRYAMKVRAASTGLV